MRKEPTERLVTRIKYERKGDTRKEVYLLFFRSEISRRVLWNIRYRKTVLQFFCPQS